jgi:hypothetical protein
MLQLCSTSLDYRQNYWNEIWILLQWNKTLISKRLEKIMYWSMHYRRPNWRKPSWLWSWGSWIYHQSHDGCHSRVRVVQSLVFCIVFCKSLFVILSFSFLLAIVLSVLLRFTTSDYAYCIFKLFFQTKDMVYYFLFSIEHMPSPYIIRFKRI